MPHREPQLLFGLPRESTPEPLRLWCGSHLEPDVLATIKTNRIGLYPEMRLIGKAQRELLARQHLQILALCAQHKSAQCTASHYPHHTNALGGVVEVQLMGLARYREQRHAILKWPVAQWFGRYIATSHLAQHQQARLGRLR